MTFQEQTDQIRTSVQLLSTLPVRILKPITKTTTLNKADMLADLAFNLDFHGIEVTESVLDADFLVFKFNGEKVGAIDVRRGRQEFQLISGEWSTDWDKFFVYMLIQKRGIQAAQAEQQDESLDHLDDELEQVQSDYEDATDASLTDAEKQLLHAHGTIGERLLVNCADDEFAVEVHNRQLHIVHVESGIAALVEYSRNNGTWMSYTPDGQLSGITTRPNRHLELFLNNIS